MFFRQIFEPKLAQYAYLIGCQKTGEAIVIDPMRDIDQYIKMAEAEKMQIVAAADTHIHADYISGLREFAERGVKVYASDEGDADWKYEWLINGNYDHVLLKDNDTFSVGNIDFKAIHTPGHTPEHIVYAVTDRGGGASEPMGLATGDFIFVGDVGRPDLLESAAGMQDVMKPSAKLLYQSIEKFRDMPEYLQIWPGHGAGSACGKALGAVPESTLGYEMRFNASLRAASSEEEFVNFILEGQPEPPLYFANMKKANKVGPRVLGGVPKPAKVGVNKIKEVMNDDNVVVLDTRDYPAFMRKHIPGSILAPFNKQFNTVAGSFVEEDKQIYLIIDEAHLHEAVTDLINVGLDHVKGYAGTEVIDMYETSGEELASIKTVQFGEAGDLMTDDSYNVLDVRKATEYNEGNVPGAQNIAHTRLMSRLDEVSGDKPLLVHCQAGGRSAVAAAMLKAKGYDVVFVDGSFNDWKEKAEAAG